VALLAAASVAAASPVRVNSETRATLTSDYTIEVVVQPHDGDAWTRLAKRLTADAANWPAIADFNKTDKLTSEKTVRVPFALLRGELQKQTVQALFPEDKETDAGWMHVVVGNSGVEGESLWNIAEWFTGRGDNYAAIRKANPALALSTHKGDVVFIPKQLLAAAFGGEREGRDGSKTAEVRKSDDDPIERSSTDANVADVAAEIPAAGLPSLTYERNAPEPFAVYRLQKGEALYSSVAIRFTGRMYSKDVGDVIDRLVQFNAIEDVSKIPTGYAVRIPMSLLLPDYLPPDDPTRLAHEAAKRESAKLARRTRARNLDGVHVILDAGHGGRDVGTFHDGVAESNYVYDVMCRLKRLLEKKSAATVAATTRSKGDGYAIAEADQIGDRTDHYVLTSPQYDLDDPVVGVHLRWYLANSMFRRAIKRGASKEKVVFLSLHADSLHPALRGAMAYIPAERFVTGSYAKRGDVYLARAEVREHPVVRHEEDESLLAEGLSRDFAESVIASFQANRLQVHPFHPIRDEVVRDGREWVPAVIRYNLVPTRLLLELCNLGNTRDRALMKTRKYRQQVAEAIYEGIVRFYADRETPAVVASGESRAASR
jgi:N-acetylmuramoyl-L-alanine amidase